MIKEKSLFLNIVIEEIRVTSILKTDDRISLFAGRPTKKATPLDAKSIIRVKIGSDKLGGITPTIGQHWKVKGDKGYISKDNHGNFVYEIDATNAECLIPADNEAMIQFITNQRVFEGTGQSAARKFCYHYHENAYKAGLNNPIETIMSDTGLTERQAKGIRKGFKKYGNLKYAKWLSQKGVPVSIITRIVKFHGQETINVISNNPWRLMDFGMSLKDTDSFARRILRQNGNEISIFEFNTDKRRLLALIEHAMYLNANAGHTVADLETIKKKLKEQDMICPNHIEGAVKLAVMEKKLIQLDYDTYASTGNYIMEATIAKRFNKLAKIERWGQPEEKAFSCARAASLVPLNDDQLIAIRRSVCYGISVITGGAGTGKTTVLNSVLKSYSELGYEINGVAVSGRATMRMYQATGRYTSTIAKYLRGNPPSHDSKYVLVIDEASMVDVKTMFEIITHLPDTARIILVGDVQQLPPIGAGKVFSDAINSQVIPSTVLGVVERQEESTGIPKYSKAIVSGKMPENLSVGNIRFHDTKVVNIEDKVTKLVKNSSRLPQILGMTKAGYKSKAGINQINNRIQEALNADGKRIEANENDFFSFVPIKENDRIMFVRNNYDKEVWNGTLGLVSVVEIKDSAYAKVQTDEGDIVDIDHQLIFDIELSYAITVHKAQGSQFPHIIVVLTNSSMANRSWLYTAITRAEVQVDIVGPISLFAKAVQTEGPDKTRKTYLKDLLIAGIKS
jgi:exodeoxyribonuclease V alpha subunit